MTRAQIVVEGGRSLTDSSPTCRFLPSCHGRSRLVFVLDDAAVFPGSGPDIPVPWAIDSNPSAWVFVRAGGGVPGGLGSPIAVRRPLFCELGAGLARPGTEGSSRCARPPPSIMAHHACSVGDEPGCPLFYLSTDTQWDGRLAGVGLVPRLRCLRRSRSPSFVPVGTLGWRPSGLALRCWPHHRALFAPASPSFHLGFSSPIFVLARARSARSVHLGCCAPPARCCCQQSMCIRQCGV